MERETGDRRVRKTKALLRRGLGDLLREKSLKDITVTELTRRVDVNRGTFYCHYKDIYDLAEQLEEEVFGAFTAVMDAYSAERLRQGLRPILRDIFEFIDRNADLCGVLLRETGENRFLARLERTIYDKVVREWSILFSFRDLPESGYYLEFLVKGTIGLVQAWGRKAQRETPEQMAALAEQLILNGIAPLRAE